MYATFSSFVRSLWLVMELHPMTIQLVLLSSLLIFFWKNKNRLIRSPCCLRILHYHLSNAWNESSWNLACTSWQPIPSQGRTSHSLLISLFTSARHLGSRSSRWLPYPGARDAGYLNSTERRLLLSNGRLQPRHITRRSWHYLRLQAAATRSV